MSLDLLADHTDATTVPGTGRHGGHIDVVREMIDGRAGSDHADFGDTTEWRVYVAKVQAAADLFARKG